MCKTLTTNIVNCSIYRMGLYEYLLYICFFIEQERKSIDVCLNSAFRQKGFMRTKRRSLVEIESHYTIEST